MEAARLIPGLPDDVALLCLARVPRRFHGRMRAVCRRWRKMLQDPDFFRARAGWRMAEPWIYALVSDNHVAHGNSFTAIVSLRAFDLQARRWMTVPGIPLPFSQAAQVQAEVVQGKLVLCGGCSRGVLLSDVAVYDPCACRWYKGQPMRRARASFITAVMRDRLYVVDPAEGMCMEWYDLVEDKWTVVNVDAVVKAVWESVRPRPAVVLGNELFLPGGPRPVGPGTQDAYRFCAEREVWSTVPSNMFDWWRYFDPFVVSNGHLFGPVPLQHSWETLAEICVYDGSRDSWRVISRQARDCAFTTRNLSSLLDLGGALGVVMSNFNVAVAEIDMGDLRMKLEWMCEDGLRQPWWHKDVLLSCQVLYA